MKKYIKLYFLFFILLMIFSNFSKLDMDAIWSYGFSNNIANGMIPYRDFNMIIGPLYPMFFSAFINIFGHYFIIFEIIHALIYSFILVLVYKRIGKDTYFFMAFLILIPFLSRYNVFCSYLFIVILLLLDSDNKYKDLIIGILIGIIFMIKHNIGIPLFIVYFFDRKKYFKSILYFSIPVIICLIYLILNHALVGYIEYCYLGMGSFLDNFVFYISILIVCICLYANLFIIYLKNKDIKIIYILAFQIVLFPIIDIDHLIPALFPIVYYYLLLDNGYIKLFLKFLGIFSIICSSIVLITTKKIVTYNNFLRYKIIDKGIEKYAINYNHYINSIDGKIYVFVFDEYLLKLFDNKKIDFYDLINEGNFGLDKEKMLNDIKDECSSKKCTFILDKKYFDKKKIQLSKDFKDYVLNNATYLETIPSGDLVYVNKIEEE